MTRVIVLGAGQGTRMRSPLPKVLHRVAGRPMISWVLDAVAVLRPASTVVVVGHEGDQVRDALPAGVIAVEQSEQLGTGHAVRVGLDSLGTIDHDETLLVVYGDMPLLVGGMLGRLVDGRGEAAAVIATTRPPSPSSFGRVIRDRSGEVSAIVEEKDATPAQRAIDEVNAGVYAFRAADLVESLAGVGTANVKGEYYLTDTIGILIAAGKHVETVEVSHADVIGVNDTADLARAGHEMRLRINARLLDDGVNVIDPLRTYVDAGVTVEAGAILYPGIHLEGATQIGTGAVVGPDTFIVDSVIGENAHVWYSVVRGAVIEAGVEVGPYSSLRPGTKLEEGAKAGTFVEMKNARVGKGAKVPHLSYMGDVTIGEGANVGAGSITCNYDGVEKHETVIGARAFIGSDTMLVAPIEIGDDAYTGAGSTITKDVEAGALAVERSEQRSIPGYSAERASKRRG